MKATINSWTLKGLSHYRRELKSNGVVYWYDNGKMVTDWTKFKRLETRWAEENNSDPTNNMGGIYG